MTDILRKVRERKTFSVLWLFFTVAVAFAVLGKNFMGIGTAVIIWIFITYQVLKD